MCALFILQDLESLFKYLQVCNKVVVLFGYTVKAFKDMKNAFRRPW